MTTRQNTHKSLVGLAALAATTAVGAGALAVPEDIDSKIANVAELGLAKLKEGDDSVLAHSLRSVREANDVSTLHYTFMA